MTKISNPPCLECQEAEQRENLDINCILNKLKSVKQSQLSSREISYLCLCLCLLSRYEKAFRMVKYKTPTIEELKSKDPEISQKGENLSADMSKTVHLYIKQMMGIDEEKRLPPWSKVCSFMRDTGCKKNQQSPQVEIQRCMFIARVKGNKISDIEMQNNLKKLGIEVETIEILRNE
ncbi:MULTISPECIES: hypothetical protein [unclassified Microcoleus]|uniref:hypothetical protein n=1 Tax=unclassified Microcoleus TaxID=2642155 RepID=UPI002FD7365D